MADLRRDTPIFLLGQMTVVSSLGVGEHKGRRVNHAAWARSSRHPHLCGASTLQGDYPDDRCMDHKRIPLIIRKKIYA